MFVKRAGTVIVTALAALVVYGGTGVAAAPTAVAKNPYLENGRIYSVGYLKGDLPKGGKFCVNLLAAHPYTPDVVLAGDCSKAKKGPSVAVSIPNSCGKYTTLATLQVNGRTTVYMKSKAVPICGRG